MMFIQYNPNPVSNRVGDCVIRAISTVTNEDWDTVYIDLAIQGYLMKDMPSSNHVWATYLLNKGFERNVIPDTCPECYTVRDFCKEHPYGRYILATGSHVIATIHGDYLDTWNSGDEVVIYFFERKER